MRYYAGIILDSSTLLKIKVLFLTTKFLTWHLYWYYGVLQWNDDFVGHSVDFIQGVQ